MMLLIAFQNSNESPESSRPHPNHRSQDHHLRNRHGDKGSRNHYGDKLGYYIDNDRKLISPLNPEVYNSRVSEDEVILKAIKDNTESRYQELVNKNDGRDVEEELRVWIGEKMTKEGKTANQQGMVLDGSDDNNRKSSGDDEGSEKEMDATTSTTTADQQKRSLDESIKGQTTSPLAAMASEGKMRELDELAVFHYPRNATGYYRGLWVRTPKNKALYDDENEDAEDEQTTIEASHNVITEEVHTWAQTQLHERKRDVSILFLPSNLYLESRRGLGQKSYTSSSSTTTKPQPPPTLTLTEETGRVAFQLYSQPIPAMSQLSIVDGVVKLYDGMHSSTTVPRPNDVLLRVRGVMIHGVGKMSLVTARSVGMTSSGRRSVLGVRQVGVQNEDEEEDAQGEAVVEQQESADSSEDEKEESVDHRHRRRLLKTAVDQIVSQSEEQQLKDDDGSSSNTIMAHIRQGVMELYSSQYKNHDIHALENKKSMENDGWSLLQSVGEDWLFENDNENNLDNDVAGGNEQPTQHRRLAETTNEDMATVDSGHSLSQDLKNVRELSPPPPTYTYPYPYVVDDAENSIKNMQSPATRRFPAREAALESNAADCEFEINIDVQSTKWTFGEWRSSMEYRLRTIGGVLNPYYWHVAMKPQLDFLEESPPKEALVMTMMGDIESTNCDFHSFVNVTAARTNWEHVTAKVINYSFYMMLTCLTQAFILHRQLLHIQSQSVASNVSILCIGWQAVIDAILCIGHFLLSSIMGPLSKAFVRVAVFKLLIIYIIEMECMAMIIRARNNRRRCCCLCWRTTLLHLKFLGALMLAIFAFWYFGQSNGTLYILLLYSFWVPQIILNIITESRKPLHPYYMYGMSITRSIAPIYVFVVRNNFLSETNPDFSTEPTMCLLLILWIGIQTAILYAQSKYGTRFMIPQRFLPPKFDPASNPSSNQLEIELGPLLDGGVSPSREQSSNGVVRNRRGGGANSLPSTIHTAILAGDSN